MLPEEYFSNYWVAAYYETAVMRLSGKTDQKPICQVLTAKWSEKIFN